MWREAANDNFRENHFSNKYLCTIIEMTTIEINSIEYIKIAVYKNDK